MSKRTAPVLNPFKPCYLQRKLITVRYMIVGNQLTASSVSKDAYKDGKAQVCYPTVKLSSKQRTHPRAGISSLPRLGY